VSADVLSFLHSSGVTTSHSPRDTPQMNSVTERWVRSIHEGEGALYAAAFLSSCRIAVVGC
jgi:hypothetical protein